MVGSLIITLLQNNWKFADDATLKIGHYLVKILARI